MWTNEVVSVRDKDSRIGYAWAEDFSPRAIRLIGLAELLGAIGLISPTILWLVPVSIQPATGTASMPAAALGLVLLLAGAVVVHGVRGEAGMMAVNNVLLLLAAGVAWGQLGSCSFGP